MINDHGTVLEARRAATHARRVFVTGTHSFPIDEARRIRDALINLGIGVDLIRCDGFHETDRVDDALAHCSTFLIAMGHSAHPFELDLLRRAQRASIPKRIGVVSLDRGNSVRESGTLIDKVDFVVRRSPHDVWHSKAARHSIIVEDIDECGAREIALLASRYAS